VADARPRLLHVITSLSTGGAEVMLRNVVLAAPSREFDMRVVSLTTFDPIGSQIARAGIATHALGARSGFLSVDHWRDLRSHILEWRPNLIHSWMYHANVATGAILTTIPRSVRGKHIAAIRAAAGDTQVQSRRTRLVRRLDAMLSNRYDRLVFNAFSARDQHERLGYTVARAVVIPNGFDTDKFQPKPGRRAATRRELGVVSEPLVGMIARYHPVKGHRHFIESAAHLMKEGFGCRFVLVGAGCDSNNAELSQLLHRHGIAGRVLLLGERSGIEDIVTAFDVVVCASTSESFPNAVGEAMASGVPCVVTDVGDCARLVGDSGWVVPVADASAMSASIAAALSLPQSAASARGRRARERIVEHYALESVVGHYRDLYTLVLADRGTA